jgi:antitoxin component YwqK of YwqJK toxin-antitoxin module
LVKKSLEKQLKIYKSLGFESSKSNAIYEFNKILNGFNKFKVKSEKYLGLVAENENVTLRSNYEINDGTTKSSYEFIVKPNTNDWEIIFRDNIYDISNAPKYPNFSWKLRNYRDDYVLMEIHLKAVVSGTSGYRHWLVALKRNNITGKPSLVHELKYRFFNFENHKRLIIEPITGIIKRNTYNEKQLSSRFLSDSNIILSGIRSTQVHYGNFSPATSYKDLSFTCDLPDDLEVIDKFSSANNHEENILDKLNKETTNCTHNVFDLHEYYYRSSLFIKDYLDKTSGYSSLLNSIRNLSFQSEKKKSLSSSKTIDEFSGKTNKEKAKADNDQSLQYKYNKEKKNGKTNVEALLDLLESKGAQRLYYADKKRRASSGSIAVTALTGKKISDDEYIKYEEEIYSLKFIESIEKGITTFDVSNETNHEKEANQKEWIKRTAYENGQLKDKITYKRSIENENTWVQWGPTERYYENGKLRSRLHYKNGKEDGNTSYYNEKGQITTSTNYKNGKRDGLSIKYYENGQIKISKNYKNEKQDGLTTAYYKNGILRYEQNYKNDSQVEK